MYIPTCTSTASYWIRFKTLVYVAHMIQPALVSITVQLSSLAHDHYYTAPL